jgi:hypothetical protein
LPTALQDELVELERRLRTIETEPPTKHKRLLNWVAEIRKLCQPENVTKTSTLIILTAIGSLVYWR